VLVPVTLTYLGAGFYGLWMAVTALTGMAAFADLGLGSGLMTKLAGCWAAGDSASARRYVSSGYFSMVAVAGGLCGTLWSVAGVVPWETLLGLDETVPPGAARAVALICVTAFVVNLPLSLVVRVQYGYQQVAQSNLWQMAGSVAAVPLALGAVRAELSPLWVVTATVIAPILGNLINSLWVYGRQLPALRPCLRGVDWSSSRELFRLSGLFLVLTVVMSVANNVDMILIARVLGLESVTAFAVPARIFAQVGLLVAVVNGPLWPANTEALAHGHRAWIRRVTARMTVASALTALLASVVVVAGADLIFDLLMGPDQPVDRSLLIGLAFWWLVLAAISPRFMAQNAAGVVWPQLIGWTAYLVLSLPAKWYTLQHVGLGAVPYVGTLGYLFTVVPSALWGYRRTVWQGSPGQSTTP
jgi:O-antigen/teichoic acid export membrane protein